jgi:hypothetical protein
MKSMSTTLLQALLSSARQFSLQAVKINKTTNPGSTCLLRRCGMPMSSANENFVIEWREGQWYS